MIHGKVVDDVFDNTATCPRGKPQTECVKAGCLQIEVDDQDSTASLS